MSNLVYDATANVHSVSVSTDNRLFFMDGRLYVLDMYPDGHKEKVDVTEQVAEVIGKYIGKEEE